MGKGTLHQMIARVAFIVSGYAINIAMVYLLGDPAAYGLLGIMINMTNIARVLVSTGLPQATSKFIAENDDDLTYPILRTSMKLQWIIGGALMVVFMAGAPAWARLLNDTTLTPYFWAAAPLIPLMGAFQVLQSYFNGTHRFVAQSWLNVLYSVTRVVFAIALVLLGTAVYGVLVGFTISLALSALVSWYYVRPRTGTANPESRRLLAFAAPLMVLAIGQAVLVNLDLLQIKAYFPTADNVGFYSGMASLSRTPYFLFTAFSVTLLPIVTSALKNHGRQKAGETIARSTTFLLITALPVIAVVAAVPGELLDFVFPKAYASAADALIWATIAQTVLALVASFTSATTAAGKPYRAMIAWLVCIPAQLVAGALLIPDGGMTGTALASLIAAGVGAIVSGAMVWRDFGKLIEPLPVLKAVGAAVVVYLLMLVPSHYSLVVLPFACLAALALYAGLVLVTGAVKRHQIVSLFKREKRADADALTAPEFIESPPEEGI